MRYHTVCLVKTQPTALLLFIFSMLLCSCPAVIDSPSDESHGYFWAKNFKTDRYYRVDAELLAAGSHCTIWAEKRSGVSSSKAREIAEEYDFRIYPKMRNAFGEDFSVEDNNGELTLNTIELADWLAYGKDGKLCILLLDIKDSYNGGSGPYTAGYFWAGNFLDTSYAYSNQRNMIYIDTYPGRPGDNNFYRTIAHELQHLMNFVTGFMNIYDEDEKDFYITDTWVDEGLSSAAEWIYAGTHTDDDVTWFNDDETGLIRMGNNFFVWGNREDEKPNAVLDDYTTVYLFFQWLRLQAGSSQIYKDIITSPYNDYQAVTNAAGKYISGSGYDDWETLLKTWLAANYINAPRGVYGYLDEPVLRNIKANTAPPGSEEIRLAPGEGVYSITTNNYPMPRYDDNSIIKYAGLSGTTDELSNTETYNGGALLTYNTNKNNNGKPAYGTITGAAAERDIFLPTPSRQAFPSGRLFAISAADMLRQNGHEESSHNSEISKLRKRAALNE